MTLNTLSRAAVCPKTSRLLMTDYGSNYESDYRRREHVAYRNGQIFDDGVLLFWGMPGPGLIKSGGQSAECSQGFVDHARTNCMLWVLPGLHTEHLGGRRS